MSLTFLIVKNNKRNLSETSVIQISIGAILSFAIVLFFVKQLFRFKTCKMQKYNIFAVLFITLIFVTSLSALRCYTGYKMVSGQSFGDKQKDCESSSDSCYNVTANAGILLSPMKAGCSTYRCYLAKDVCRSIEYQGVPVSFCCCSTDLCNGK